MLAGYGVVNNVVKHYDGSLPRLPKGSGSDVRVCEV